MRATGRAVAFVCLLALGACRETFQETHVLEPGREGYNLDGAPVSDKTLSDSLVPFCREKAQKVIWRLDADSTRRFSDLMRVLRLVAGVSSNCQGIFAFGTDPDRPLVQPPYPAPYTIYETGDWRQDTSKPHLSLLVEATRRQVLLRLRDGWLPPVDLVADEKGREYLAPRDSTEKVATGWVDRDGRCAVPLRQALCAKDLDSTGRVVMLGNLESFPDTIDLADPRQRGRLARAPITLELALRSRIHAARTLPGAMDPGKAYYHGIIDSTMPWPTVVRLMKGLRQAGVDFNTLEAKGP